MDDEEDLDPRIKVELEILNQAASDVNRLEKEIDEARSKYQATFSECSHQLETLGKKFSTAINHARPYYALKDKAREAQSEALRSARKFQSANGVYIAAKETISLAELRLMDDKAACLSPAWQEMLNHALLRVTEAEREKTQSEKDHHEKAAYYAETENKMHQIEKKHRKATIKAKPYFDMKQELELKLKQIKQSMEDLQQAVQYAKTSYSRSLKRLEAISEGIHETRKQKLLLMYPREPGVGAEETSFHLEESPQFSESKEWSLQFPSDGFDPKLDDQNEDSDTSEDSMDNDCTLREKVLYADLDEKDRGFFKSSILRGRKDSFPGMIKSISLPTDLSVIHDPKNSNRNSDVDLYYKRKNLRDLQSTNEHFNETLDMPLDCIRGEKSTQPDGESFHGDQDSAFGCPSFQS